MRTAIFALAICLLSFGGTQSLGASLRIDSERLFFSGKIAKGDAEAFNTILSDAVRVVVVKSPGGFVDEAIKIGSAIQARSINVEVDSYCMSSCANYIFLPAKKKVIRNGGVLCFHGGTPRSRKELEDIFSVSMSRNPQSVDLKNYEGSFDKYVDSMWERHQNFLVDQRKLLSSIGVREELLYPVRVAIPDFAKEDARKMMEQRVNVMALWCPTPETMMSFGVSDLEMWYPENDQELYQLGRKISSNIILSRKRIGD